MTSSSSSLKILIAELVEKLDDDGCINVIRLLQNELGHNTLNRLVIHIIMQCTKKMRKNSLIKLINKIKKQYPHDQDPDETDTTISTITNNNININSNTHTNVLFPLHRLPDDLTLKTSLFLNEKDIFQFEQCCRLFYKMINNTSYLSQCNNFKEFTITKVRLHQMKQSQYCFLKYSKANQLTSNLNMYSYKKKDEELAMYNRQRPMTAAVNDFEKTTHKTKKMGSYDNWVKRLFKSISILVFDKDTAPLLCAIPMDILFNPNPNESKLKRIELGHCSSSVYKNTWKKYMDKFEQEYLECQKNLEKQGLKIKSLECLKNIANLSIPRYIHSKHVWIDKIDFDLGNDKFLTNKCNPGMKILTIESWINFSNNVSTRDSIIRNRGLEIETMRLLSQYRNNICQVCHDKSVIESLNLHNSLKNLTIEISSCETQKRVLTDILDKKYYYNLENVNILLDTKHYNTDWFFKLLKHKKEIIKHQFRQFNIAMFGMTAYPRPHDVKYCFVFEWNKKMDDKWLDQIMKQFHKVQLQRQDQKQKGKYLFMRNQWLD